MAEKLLQYFQYIGEMKGFEGKVKLAQITKIPSTKASLLPDTTENLQIFRKAVQEITGKAAPDI